MADQPKVEPTVSDTLLVNLEKDFNDAMAALEGEEALGHFRLEYEKLYRALKQSHESEKRLVAQCQELTQELLSNAAKMQAAVKLSKGDHSTIEALKKEIEKAWRAVDSANDKDLRARETVKTLKEEIETLKGMIQEGGTFSSDHASTLEELKLENKRLQVESEEMNKQIELYTRELSEMAVTLKEKQNALNANRDETERITDRFELVRQEYRREKNARDRSEFQAKELLVMLKGRQSDVQALVAKEAELGNAVATLTAQIAEQQQKKQALQKKLDTVEKQLFHTQQSYNDCLDTTTDLNEKLQQKDKMINETEKKITETLDEIERLERLKVHDFKELSKIQQQNDAIKQEHESLKFHQQSITKRIDSYNKEKDSLLRALKLMQSERENLEKAGANEALRKEKLLALLQQEEKNLKDMEEDIKREEQIGVRLRNQIEALEKERERYVTEVSQIGAQQASALEELKMVEIDVDELQKRIDEKESKIGEQQGEYEKIRTERNQFSKKLVEAQDEIVELKQKFKLMDHQISQFKEEVQMKSKKSAEENSKQKAMKERLAKTRKKVNDFAANFEASKTTSEMVQQDIKQLVKIITVFDKELSDKQKEIVKLTGERDTLGTQLIRRNDELALLYEKLRIQNETAANGESGLRARLDDIRILRLKTTEVKRQATLANNKASKINELKESIRQVERDLEAEKKRSAALAEELENPNNTSRWRKIEGKDASEEELESKLSGLQKRLILKSEECLEQEMALQEKERLVTELQSILSRQPGPQVAAKLNSYQKDLQKRNARMKQKASELNMTSTHIEELKYEAERLRRELHDTKRKYYEIKMKNDLLVNPRRALTPPADASQQGRRKGHPMYQSRPYSTQGGLPLVPRKTVGDVLSGTTPRPLSAPLHTRQTNSFASKSSRSQMPSLIHPSPSVSVASTSTSFVHRRRHKRDSIFCRPLKKMTLTTRLFAYHLIVNSPNSVLLNEISKCGAGEFVQRVTVTGGQLGLRSISAGDFNLLVTTMFPSLTFEDEDVLYIFRFLDWGGHGKIDFQVLKESVRTLFASRNVIAALCCKHLLSVKTLDKALVTVGELDIMFAALRELYAQEVPDTVLRLCDEIKLMLLKNEMNYSFSVRAVQEAIFHFPSFVGLLQRIQWDGTLESNLSSQSRLLELVKREETVLVCASSKKESHDIRKQYNAALLSCYRDIYRGVGVEDGEEDEREEAETPPDQKMEYTRSAFVCDRYMVQCFGRQQQTKDYLNPTELKSTEALMIVADIIRQNDTYDRCGACGSLLSALDMTGTFVKDPLYLLGENAFVIPDSSQLLTPDALKTHILADCLEQQSVAQQNCLSLLTQTETELENFASTLFYISLTESPLVTSQPYSESMTDPEELPNWESLGNDYAKEYVPEVGPLGFEQGRRIRQDCPVKSRPLLLPATKNVREHYYTPVWYLQYPLHPRHAQYCFPFVKDDCLC